MTDTLPSSNPEPISSKKILYAEIERLENRLRSLNKKDYAFRKEFLDTFKLIGTLVGSTPFKWIYFFTFPFTLLFRLLFLRVTPPEVKEQAKSYFKKFRNELRNFKNPLDTEIVGFISEIEQSITIGSKAAQNRHAAETSKSVLIGNITIPTAEYYKTDSAKKIKVACILDTFSTASWDPEFELIHLTRGQWKRQIEQNKPAFLLVESAWRGHNSDWVFALSNSYTPHFIEFVDIMNFCKKKKLPTVFWNKEDPVNFSKFIDTAKFFDHIYTTDEASVRNYKVVANNSNVGILEFAAQPVIHNPVKRNALQKYGICFAGTWHGNKYEERQKQITFLLDAASNFDLHIFDRQFNRTDKDHFKFPTKFQKYIRGSLSYDQMLVAYKCFKIILNVNSVTDSRTMLSRRVFESLACGTPVVSTSSKALQEFFGDLVSIPESKEEATEVFAKLLEDQDHHSKVSHLGLRKTLSQHTYSELKKRILSDLGLANDEVTLTVMLILPVASINEAKRGIEIFEKQSHNPKKLLIIPDTDLLLNQLSLEISRSDITILRSKSLLNTIKEALDSNTDEFWGFLDPQCSYGAFYISDLLLANQYTDADMFTKSEIITHDFVEQGRIGVSLMRRNFLKKVVSEQEHEFVTMEQIRLAQIKASTLKEIYCCDSYNFRNTIANSENWVV